LIKAALDLTDRIRQLTHPGDIESIHTAERINKHLSRSAASLDFPKKQATHPPRHNEWANLLNYLALSYQHMMTSTNSASELAYSRGTSFSKLAVALIPRITGEAAPTEGAVERAMAAERTKNTF
jgi:hypothetical protein